MIKNFYMSEAQADGIRQNKTLSHLSPSIVSLIKDNKSPLSFDNKVHKKNLCKMLYNGFVSAKSVFKDNIEEFSEEEVSNRLEKLIAIAKKKEEKAKTQLEGICESVANELCAEQCKVECKIVNAIQGQENFIFSDEDDIDIQYDSIQDIEDTEKGKKKKKIINTLTIGCAIDLYDYYFKKNIDKIFEIDEELPHLYSKIVKINNYLLYISKKEITKEDNFQSGCVEVTVGKNPKISAIGTLFPFLLTETIRGIIEYKLSKYFFDSYNVYNKRLLSSDLLTYEPFNMTVGSELWKEIYTIDDKKYAISVVENIAKLDADSVMDGINEFICKTRVGDEWIQSIIDRSLYDNDYADFEKDLLNKIDKQNLIIDGQCCEEYVDEAAYPSGFDIDTFRGLNTFASRVRYCNEHLKRLGSGTARIVYQIDDNTVLKLAKNRKGVAQNEAEVVMSKDYYKPDVFANVYEADDTYLWIEMQLAKKAKPSDFLRITGYSFETVNMFIQYLINNSRAKSMHRYIPQKYLDLFGSEEFNTLLENTDSLFYQLQEYVFNFQNNSLGDLNRISSWGIVKDTDGEERLVIVDFGINDDVYNDFYLK